eukprot:gene56039-76810_t
MSRFFDNKAEQSTGSSYRQSANNKIGSQIFDDYTNFKQTTNSRGNPNVSSLASLVTSPTKDYNTTDPINQSKSNPSDNSKLSRKKVFASSDTISPITGEPVTNYSNSRNEQTQKQSSTYSNLYSSIKNKVGVESIISKFKEAMKSHGANGFIGLQRKFRIIDDDG